MFPWNIYPYLNLTDANLDWIIKQVKASDKEIDDFTALNKITWAGTWDISNYYTQWSIVEDNGDGYIAIVPVPRNVPISDTNYWVMVANFSVLYAAFAQRITDLENAVDNIDNTEIPGLQTQVDNLSNQVSDGLKRFIPNGRTYLFIADSYGQSTNSDGHNFIEQAMLDLGITSYYAFIRGSSGFTQTGSQNFLAVLTDNESAITDKDTITDIIVLGGANDQASPADIADGIKDFMDYVKVEYTNANVYIGHFTNSISPSLSANLSTSIANYRKETVVNGAGYINNSEYIMAKLSFFNNDNVHPAEAGLRALTKYLTEFILYGSIDVYETANNCFAAYDSSITVTYDYIQFVQHNGVVSVFGSGGGGGLGIQYSASHTFTAGHVVTDNMLTLTDGFFYSCKNVAPGIQVQMGLSSSRFWNAILFARNIGSNKVSRIGTINYLETAVSGTDFALSLGSTSFALFE